MKQSSKLIVWYGIKSGSGHFRKKGNTFLPLRRERRKMDKILGKCWRRIRKDTCPYNDISYLLSEKEGQDN